jgi:DNA-binding NarL/FixJ family response regulator
VSRKRPSQEPSEQTASRTPDQDKASVAYWRQRLFRNTYRHRGRIKQTRGWAVKIQHERRRKTFVLAASDPQMAAHEARRLYLKLIAEGWDALLPAGKPARALMAGLELSLQNVPESEPSFWEPRLVARRYLEGLGSDTAGQWSACIEQGGQRWYFPLGTNHRGEAALRACDIYRAIWFQGWDVARLQFPIEVTVAVLWASTPMACTYTTVLTVPANQPDHRPDPSASEANRRLLLLVEPDGGVRRALRIWLERGRYAPRVEACVDIDSARQRCNRRRPDLILFNQRALDGASSSANAEWLVTRPDLTAYSYGVYPDSDQIFMAQSGVMAGYLLRRRVPDRLLEPLDTLGPDAPCDAARCQQAVKRYFQTLFEPEAETGPPGGDGSATLTPRERQLLNLLTQGLLDKEIAAQLNVSVWTVHSHLKRIFQKYQVHTRTEAVVKHLQK